MLKKTVLFLIILFIGIQFIPADKTNPEVDAALTLKTDESVMKLLKSSCYDCHSFETKWPYYADIAPISFFVSGHVNDARAALNFSVWEAMDVKIKEARLKRAITTVNNEMMALPSYVAAHEEAKLTKAQKEILTEWFKKELEKIPSTQTPKLIR